MGKRSGRLRQATSRRYGHPPAVLFTTIDSVEAFLVWNRLAPSFYFYEKRMQSPGSAKQFRCG
jgi:hypothetical protein